LLDNFYVDGEVSADGHEWSTAAYATDFVERTWPISYAATSAHRIRPKGGPDRLSLVGLYLGRAKKAGISYISFGEFAESPRGDKPAEAKVEALEGHVDPKFPTFDLSISDQVRADRFLEVLKEWPIKAICRAW